jgi:hypothetical protein
VVMTEARSQSFRCEWFDELSRRAGDRSIGDSSVNDIVVPEVGEEQSNVSLTDDEAFRGGY